MNRFAVNSFQVTNYFVDHLLVNLSGDEVKCYLIIIRKTLGWETQECVIPTEQFKQLTDLSSLKIITACKRLVELGLVTQTTDLQGRKIYAMDLSG